MKQLISFSKFLALPEEIQEQLSTFDNAYITEELSTTAHKKKMLELEKKLKAFDFWYSMGDRRAWEKGMKANAEIKKMMDELGDDAKELYKMYAKKSNVALREEKKKKKDLKPASEYEVFLQMKMREWEIKSLEELEAQLLKKFWAEVDKEWKGNPDVEVNIPEEKRGLFPEMDKVQRQGSLGYGDDRKVGEKSLTAGSFVDTGNLYPEHLTPKWQPPSPQRKRGWQDK
jgi:hypothetical protein